MDDPESWRWIWLVAAVVFGLGEMATPGSFFLAPFAIGAAAAAALAFADASAVFSWSAFVGVSLACLFALRPLARRLDQQGASPGVGSRRLIGRPAFVLEAVTPGGLGLVRIDQEEWRAATAAGRDIEVGERVVIVEMEGTKVIVTPVDETPQ